jgi:DNA-binding response OmpR family regulator
MKRILIIDDDLELLSILREIFVQEGFEVVTYPDKNSIKGVIICEPDIILLDERLNDGFGHEFCEKIKANPLTCHIPVILVSGYERLSELTELCGADGYLAKPFDLDAAVRLVTQQLILVR